MKQILQQTTLRLLLAAFLLSFLPATVIWGQSTQPSGGGSSASDPYQISERAHLEWMADQIENYSQTFDGKFFKLQNNIDLSDAPLTPIGRDNSYPAAKFFAGTFDGDGYTISGLHFEASSSYEDYGLFGQVGQHGVIKNLGVEIAPEGICTNNQRTLRVGGIVGEANECTIKNCYVTGGRIYCDGDFPSRDTDFAIAMGGIAGNAYNTTIQNCYSTIDITLEFENAVTNGNLGTEGIRIAGIAGKTSGGTVTNCWYSGQLKAHADFLEASHCYAAGITDEASTISNCLVLSRSIVVSIDTENNYGNYYIESKTIARSCSNFTSNYVSPLTTVNGAAPGYNNGTDGTKWTSITDSDAPISTWTATGKWAANSEWDNCMPTLKKEDGANPFQSTTKQPYVFKEATPIPIGNATELAAINTNGAHLAGSYILTSDIDLTSYNSGKWTPIGTVTPDVNTPFTGSFDGDGYVISGLNVDLPKDAGLFGTIESGTVENLGVHFGTLRSTGDATMYSSGSAFVGGIAGEAKNTTIRNCYTVGGSIITDTGFDSNAGGGIIGNGTESTILNCYSICNNVSLECTGSVNGGGIAGSGRNLTVSNCYAICKIKGESGGDAGGGSSIAGGIVGEVSGYYGQPAEQSSISNCLALIKDELELTNTDGYTNFYPGRILGQKGYNSNATLTGNYATTLMPGTWTATSTDKNDGADWNGANCTPSEPDVWDIAWDNMTTRSRAITGPNLPKLRTADKSKTINGQNDIDKLLYIGFKLSTSGTNGAIEVKSTPGGVSYNNGDFIPGNTELTITAKPNSPYEISSLKVAGNDFTSGSTYTVGNDLATKGTDLSIEATFAILHTVTVDGAIANGSIAVSKPDGTKLNTGANTIEEGTQLTIASTPANGYRLKTLTADGSPVTSPYTVTTDVTLSAEFEPIPGGDEGGGDGGDPTPPTVYHTVTLPAVEGATTDPVAGDYNVESWGSFRFYLSVDKEYDQSVPVVTTSRGETITPRTSDGAYIIRYVRQPLEIFIDGIVKNPDPVANEKIETEGIRIYAANGYLHIQTPKPEKVYIFTPDGRLKTILHVTDSEERVALPKGVYFVKVGERVYKTVL